MKRVLLKNGRLTGFGTLCCIALAIALISYTLFVAESRLLGIGSIILALALLGCASLSNSATSIGLPPPFTSDPLGWRKAKQSYKADKSGDDKNNDSGRS